MNTQLVTTAATLPEVAPCFHCGQACLDEHLHAHDHDFCCLGCQRVFELLSQHDLKTYYKIAPTPGQQSTADQSGRFAYLDDPKVEEQLLDFSDGQTGRVTLLIPQIHCASCIWLLENLYKIKPGLLQSKVQFLRKEVSLSFDHSQTSLRELVELLALLGYEPTIRLDSQGKRQELAPNNRIYTKLGVAGFCFGNIMLFSFPEYLSFGSQIPANLRQLFEGLNLALALPVLFYSATDYFRNAWVGMKQRQINMDLPISLGLLAIFLRSCYEVLSKTGPGFFDSLAGLVFFLLLGRIFQQKTYDRLSFTRDYQSYFPLSVSRLEGEEQVARPVKELRRGDQILIRNQELVPCDSTLLSGSAQIDYSFVTGESKPVERQSGELIYAGGRVLGQSVRLAVLKEVSGSYLTQLWNNEVFSTVKEGRLGDLSQQAGRYFTPAVLLLAFTAGLFWWIQDADLAVKSFTAVLIVACPCALALAVPFSMGTALRVMGRNQFYLRDASVVEDLAHIDVAVFDKTGTLTSAGSHLVQFEGKLSAQEQALVACLASQSTHPLSRSIHQFLGNPSLAEVQEFLEVPGQGLQGRLQGQEILLGSRSWLALQGVELEPAKSKNNLSQVYLAISGRHRGTFSLQGVYREGIQDLLQSLQGRMQLALLSGDNNKEEEHLKGVFPPGAELHFQQSPLDKLNHVHQLKQQGKKVMMLGDGLNDAGALKASHIGIAVSEDISSFSPACDGILGSQSFGLLEKFLTLARHTRWVVLASFGISIFYNVIGVSYAVQGLLSPLFCAILMPISSLSVVLFATGATLLSARRLGL